MKTSFLYRWLVQTSIAIAIRSRILLFALQLLFLVFVCLTVSEQLIFGQVALAVGNDDSVTHFVANRSSYDIFTGEHANKDIGSLLRTFESTMEPEETMRNNWLQNDPASFRTFLSMHWPLLDPLSKLTMKDSVSMNDAIFSTLCPNTLNNLIISLSDFLLFSDINVWEFINNVQGTLIPFREDLNNLGYLSLNGEPCLSQQIEALSPEKKAQCFEIYLRYGEKVAKALLTLMQRIDPEFQMLGMLGRPKL